MANERLSSVQQWQVYGMDQIHAYRNGRIISYTSSDVDGCKQGRHLIWGLWLLLGLQYLFAHGWYVKLLDPW